MRPAPATARPPAVRRIRQPIARTFAPQLARHRGAARGRLLAKLIALCDVTVWKTFRRVLGRDRAETRRAMIELVELAIGPRPSA